MIINYVYDSNHFDFDIEYLETNSDEEDFTPETES